MTTQLLVVQDAESLEIWVNRKCTSCWTGENCGQAWKKYQIIHVLCKISQLWKYASNSKDVRNLHKNFIIAVNPCFATHNLKKDRKGNISSSYYLFKMYNSALCCSSFQIFWIFFPKSSKKSETVFTVVTFYFPKLFQGRRVWFLTKWFCQHSL